MISSTVLIHIDALRRDYCANWALAKNFEDLGYKVILSSRSSTHRLLKFFTPDIVILSHVFTLSESELASLHMRGARIFSNEVEGEIEGNEIGISGTYPRKIAYQYFEKIFTWSKWSAEWLVRERQMDPARVCAVGSIRLGLLKMNRPHTKGKKIGILSRFELINTFDARHPFENLMEMDIHDVRGRTYLNRAIIEMEGFSITCRVIESLVHQGIEVSIRPHPNENIIAYKLLKKRYGSLLEVNSSADYSEWLQTLTAVVGTLSSAYTEPFLLGIPIISIDALQENSYQSYHLKPFIETFSQACYLPKDLAALLSLCADPKLEPIENFDLQQKLSAIYYLDNSKNPIINIVEEVKPTGRTISRLSGIFIRQAKILLDFMTIVICILRKNPKLAFQKHLIYDYNSLLHRPSSFMMTSREFGQGGVKRVRVTRP
jgi:surface carbohydrate biosynthesis protein